MPIAMRSTAHEDPPDRFIYAPAERKPAVLELIRRAERRLTLSLFRCNDLDVFVELAAAVSRGVAVDVLVTSHAKGGRHKLEKLWHRLEETGARVHRYRDPVVKYHAKYLVIDDGPAVVASLNFTRKCFERTCDALVVTCDRRVVKGLHGMMGTDRDALPLQNDLCPRLIVGPEHARRRFTEVIEAARSTICLIDAKLSDPDLVTLLKARESAGLLVERFTSKQVGGLKSHGKIMLVDDHLAVVGSLALSALGLDFRREVAIVIDEPSAIADVKALVQAARAAHTPGSTVGPEPGASA
jgi:phosphatidylserine/phosphatidylglycerophosphate/cardiolipin synthase-like enzyme